MFGLVSKKKYEKLETQWQILRKDYRRMIAVKSYFVLKYLYPDIDPILIGGKENYQKVLEEISSIEKQKKMILEKKRPKETADTVYEKETYL